MPRARGLAAAVEALAARHWWRSTPSLLCQALRPLSWLYRGLLAMSRRGGHASAAPVPVLVVGNYIVGGAGKTPAVIAIVQALQQRGWHPGVVSRGFGRRGDSAAEVLADSAADDVGDEPLLIHRRTGVPVWVARRRVVAARALCARHAEVDVVVCDDGLQHHGLARDAELAVFDERGIGNGLLLPAGPLREPLPAGPPRRQRVLYTGSHASTAWAGAIGLRALVDAVPLQAWWRGDLACGQPVATLRGRPLFALAGLAAPENFFSRLETLGLQIERHPMPDHAPYPQPPWPAGTPDVVTTEKDAVKLRPEWAGDAAAGATRVWVLRLDLTVPDSLVTELAALLHRKSSP